MEPKVSVLENVPSLAQEAALENGEMGSDLDFIIEEFEKKGMSALDFLLDRIVSCFLPLSFVF